MIVDWFNIILCVGWLGAVQKKYEKINVRGETFEKEVNNWKKNVKKMIVGYGSSRLCVCIYIMCGR